MFSNDLKNEMKKKFNLTESIINSSKHYKIPRFVFKEKSVKPINKNYNFFMKNHIISLRNYLNNKSDELKKLSKTQYFERKRENMNKLLTKIQRDKIDLLINKAYENINDNIREYNNSLSLSGREYKIKLDFLPAVQKQIIIDHVMTKAHKYLPLINKKYEFLKYGHKEVIQRNFDEEKKNKQMKWSHNILQQKKLEDYHKIYRIKYLNSEEQHKKLKFKDEFIQKDFDNPKNDNQILSISKNRTHSSIKNNNMMNFTQTTNSENKFFKPKNIKN